MVRVTLKMASQSCSKTELLSLLLFELEDNEKTMVGKINSYLLERNTRMKGLYLLEEIIPTASHDVLVDNVPRWLRLCSTAFWRTQKEDKNVVKSFCRVVSLLLEEAKQSPEISSTLGSQTVVQLVPVLTSMISVHLYPATQCLNTILRMFGGPCGPFKDNIRKSLIEQFQRPLSNNMSKAFAVSWALLPQTGGGGKDGENHSKEWIKQCQDTIATAHSILDCLLTSVVEYTDWNLVGKSLFAVEFSTEKANESEGEALVSDIVAISSMYVNTMRCLQAMLCCNFPVNVSVPLSDLLKLCLRSLGVTGERLAINATLLKRAQLSVISTVHIETLILLKSIILSCGKNLLPHGTLIQRVIIQTVKGIAQRDPVSGRELCFRELKIEAYDALQVWLESSGSCSLYVSEFSSDIISELLNTINISEDASKIKEDTNKKKRKKIKTRSKWISGSDVKLQCKAILLLTAIIYTNTPLLTPASVKQIQEVAFGSLAELQTKKLEECSPFTQPLRDLSKALLLSPHPNWPVPTHYASKVLNDLVGSSISSSLCHPCAMPLDLPILLKEQRQNEMTARDPSQDSEDETMDEASPSQTQIPKLEKVVTLVPEETYSVYPAFLEDQKIFVVVQEDDLSCHWDLQRYSREATRGHEAVPSEAVSVLYCDSQWYRGIVLEKLQRKYKVLMPDFGILATVKDENIVKLDPKFTQDEMRGLYVKVSESKEMSNSLWMVFKDLIERKATCEMTVKSVEGSVPLVSFSCEGVDCDESLVGHGCLKKLFRRSERKRKRMVDESKMEEDSGEESDDEEEVVTVKRVWIEEEAPNKQMRIDSPKKVTPKTRRETNEDGDSDESWEILVPDPAYKLPSKVDQDTEEAEPPSDLKDMMSSFVDADPDSE